MDSAGETTPAFLSRRHGVPWIELGRFPVDPAVASLVRPDIAWKYGFVPLCRAGGTLTIATADPANVSALDDIKFMTGYTIEAVVASETAVAAAIASYYPATRLSAFFRPGGPTTPSTVETASRGLETLETTLEQGRVELIDDVHDVGADTAGSQAVDAPVVRLVNLLLMSAVQKGASDIHIEPYERELRVRCRIDGILQTVMAPPLAYRDAIAARVKIMARLDIAEKRLPQDGRIKIRFNDNGRRKEIDFRVSVLPTLFGEKIVLRLLDRDLLMLDLTSLGFEPESLAGFESGIRRPWGMVLVTGPTGSGKTNTLYSCIASLNTPATNIVTAEDPVEFNFAGINQVQVRDSIGLDFAAALRAFLRQDPNIILVGEIRDAETAGIAVKASLTGRLVLSTLHTNDAPSAISRLTNMGVEPFLVASSVHLICAQRLVRRICTHCAGPAPYPAAALIRAGFSAAEAVTVQPRKGAGCSRCHSTGYRGRVGLYEVMVVSEALRELILAGAPTLDLRRQAVADGMITLRRSGLRKVIEGITTLEEVVRESVH
jgi:type IV pilus assembly protein PilB